MDHGRMLDRASDMQLPLIQFQMRLAAESLKVSSQERRNPAPFEYGVVWLGRPQTPQDQQCRTDMSLHPSLIPFLSPLHKLHLAAPSRLSSVSGRRPVPYSANCLKPGRRFAPKNRINAKAIG